MFFLFSNHKTHHNQKSKRYSSKQIMFAIWCSMSSLWASAYTNGTYNSFIQQVGYCKMQSYDTVSRSTSHSVPMFMDGRVLFGVGISDVDMKETPYQLCGMCIEITHVHHFYEWNFELTHWNESASPVHSPFVAMVFDRCPDAICIRHFLDFDIYHPRQPVFDGNPTQLAWREIPCPVRDHERIEYLLCTSDTCNAQDKDTTVRDIIERPVYYWTLTIRNMRYPIAKVFVRVLLLPSDSETESNFELVKDNAWTWNFGLYPLSNGINLTIVDKHGKQWEERLDFDSILSENTATGYHGGIIIASSFQN